MKVDIKTIASGEESVVIRYREPNPAVRRVIGILREEGMLPGGQRPEREEGSLSGGQRPAQAAGSLSGGQSQAEGAGSLPGGQRPEQEEGSLSGGQRPARAASSLSGGQSQAEGAGSLPGQRPAEDRRGASPGSSGQQRDGSRFWGRTEDKTVCANYDEILYLESVDEKVFACTKDQVLRIDGTLHSFLTETDDEAFFRCSKSMVINVDRVVSLKSLSSNRIDAVMENGEHIIISRRYASEFRRLLRGDR